MRKWNIFGLFVLLLTVLTACNQAQIAEQATKNTPVTTKAEMDAEEAIKEAVPEADTDSLIASTTAELISSITPDAHIILKSGTYNFSALTEAEIAVAGAYVDPDLLKQGECAGAGDRIYTRIRSISVFSVYTGRGNAQAGLWGSRRWLYISAGWQLLL